MYFGQHWSTSSGWYLNKRHEVLMTMTTFNLGRQIFIGNSVYISGVLEHFKAISCRNFVVKGRYKIYATLSTLTVEKSFVFYEGSGIY